jgi:hypothetical protein
VTQDLAQDVLSWETAGTSVRDDVLDPDNTSWDGIEAVSECVNGAISVKVHAALPRRSKGSIQVFYEAQSVVLK